MLKLRLSLILFFILLFGIGWVELLTAKLQEQRAALKKIPFDIKVQYSKDSISSESWAIDGTYLGKMKFNPEQIK
ncbi:MAG: hypothetical protein R3D26_17210 [Cyanobacteriota/Melainabacteria group bacterium]